MRIPARARAVLDPLSEQAHSAGLPLFLVGGCVRDWLLGRSSVSDLDLCVVGDASPLARACARQLNGRAEAFGRFGTLRVLAPFGLRVDFARARREAYPSPACLPEVSPARSIEEDLIRRDFTVNAMALRLSPRPRVLVDPMDGLADLGRGTLRLLHPESFRDDPTRVFRAARYLARFGFSPAPEMASAARRALAAGHAARLSPHRVLQELLRILEEKDPGPALKILRRWGYLRLVHPRLSAPRRFILRDPAERLALLALSLGPEEALRWMDSLPLERGPASLIRETLIRARDRAAARSPISPFSLRVLKAAYPALAPGALKPLFLSGKDVSARGVAPGRRMGEILGRAARLQWRGRLSSRRQALAWLDGSGLKKS
ncbi:MAG: CCA tRNA nucleotidyltransferase [Elusimicrobia bacterium]|nr:CCA tRNA nucleotidyltransferase [Elusimicrobiota bacterium]MDE2313945.1 CCA tRNA nucleotidyltransferase [Elusimicrobiota bacterium]